MTTRFSRHRHHLRRQRRIRGLLRRLRRCSRIVARPMHLYRRRLLSPCRRLLLIRRWILIPMCLCVCLCDRRVGSAMCCVIHARRTRSVPSGLGAVLQSRRLRQCYCTCSHLYFPSMCLSRCMSDGGTRPSSSGNVSCVARRMLRSTRTVEAWCS